MAALEHVLGLMCPARISAPREAALGWMLDSWNVLERCYGARSFLPLCEEKRNIAHSCYFASLMKLLLVMIAISISQRQKRGSCSFNRLLDFLTNFFPVLTEKEIPEMSCSN